MVFLAAFVALLYANGIALLRVKKHKTLSPLPPVFHMLAMLSGTVAFMLGIVDKFRTVVPNHNISVPLFCAAGLFTFAAFAIKTAQIVRSGDDAATGRGGWRLGISAVMVCIGVYVAATVVDHYWFFRGESAGIVDVDFLNLKDPPCSGYALLRFDGDEAVYRCPTLLAFGSLLSQPFVPWPGYVQGSSREMKASLDRAMRDAEKTRKNE